MLSKSFGELCFFKSFDECYMQETRPHTSFFLGIVFDITDLNRAKYKTVSGGNRFPRQILDRQAFHPTPSPKHTDTHIRFSREPYVVCHRTLSAVVVHDLCPFRLSRGSGRGREGMSGRGGRKEKR